MEINTIYNSDWMNNGLPDQSVDLIIADPPYFEVKGDFDFIWDSFDDYLKDVEKWAIECKRVLKDNGTLFWYGDDKRIAYAQIIFDKHFSLINSLIWYKYNLRGGMFGSTGGDSVRSFPICTERILMYDKGEDKSGAYMIFANPELFMPIKKYLDEEHEKTGLTLREMCDTYGSTCSHYFGFSKRNKEQFSIPTKEKYELLQKTGFFNRDYEELRKEYEELRKEYEELRRPFSNFLNLNEVLQFNTNTNKTYQHDTIKPEKLTRALMLTCSKADALVLVPFAGSGTECAMAQKENRNFIGFEIDEKYHEVAMNRLKHQQEKSKQQSLF